MAEDLSGINSGVMFPGDGLSPDRAAPKDQSFLGGLAATIASTIPEMVGGRETPESRAFEETNPIAHGVASFATNLVPYIGAEKAMMSVPKIAGGIEHFVEGGGNAFTQGARRAVAVVAPVEAAKIAGTAVANPEEVRAKVQEGLFNIGFGALGGAAIEGLLAGGKVPPPPLPKQAVGSDLKAPTQLKMRELKKQLATPGLSPEATTTLRGQIADLETAVRLEPVGLTPLKVELANDGDAREIARIFKDTGSKAGNIRKARLIRSSEDFADDVTKDSVITRAGLRDNFDAVQLPRYVAAEKDQWAKKISDDLTVRAKMTAIDDNTLVAQEKSGMWLMARKITGKLEAPKGGDEWVVWRTDQPGRFSPEVQGFADKMVARMAFLRQDNLAINPAKPASILDETRLMVSQTPIKEFRAAEAEFGKMKQGVDKIAESLGFKPGEEGSSFLTNRAKALIDQYLTPKLYQFAESPVAKYVVGHADRAFAQAKYLSQRIIHGAPVDDASRGFGKVFGSPTFDGMMKDTQAVKPILDSLDEADIHKMQEIADIVAGVEDPIKTLNDLRAAGSISENLHRALLDFDKLDGMLVDDLVNHQAAAQRNDLNPMKGHLMLSRVWEGDFRAPIVNESGEFLYIASGKTPEAADKLAKKIISESGMTGVKHIPAERFDAISDLKLAGQIATRSKDYGVLSAANTRLRGLPQTFQERSGVGGYKTKYSRNEMLDRVSSHINDRYNYMARLSVDTALEKELGWLQSNDPKAFASVSDRLRQMSGKPGAVGQFINSATDKLLKPALGRNSATKISGFLNESLYHIQLGFGNLAFPAVNAVTFIQTVMPELAFVMNGAESSVMRNYYDVFLAGGKDLKPRGAVSALSPMKLLAKSFRQMASGKDDALYNSMLSRANREGVIDPRMLDEFIGQSSEMSTKLRDVLKGEEPFTNLIRTWSSFLPSKSERFARGQAFTSGYLVGKDVLGLSDEALYTFSRKFTERTMFNYATQDRATLMTGPLGRTFGLFKNWQTHYIFSMMQYADEAYRFGNWSPLLWQMGGTTAVGGVAALPMFAVADSFSKMAGDKSVMQRTYEAFGPSNPDSTGGTFSDAIYMGLPAFMGVSLTGNAAAPFSDPMRDAAQLMSFPQWDRMRRLGSAVGDAIDTWAVTGDHPILSPEVRDQFVAALAPKAIARSMQITQDNALKSLNTGNVVMKGMNMSERLMWMSGITPRRVGLAYEAADELWKDQEKRKTMTTQYGRAWAEAQMGQDWDKLEELRQEAMVLGLDVTSVAKSAASFREKRSTEMIQRQFSPEARSKLQSLGLPGF